MWGLSYVNDFMDCGWVKKVYVQVVVKYWMLFDDINFWYVCNSSGMMVLFLVFVILCWEIGLLWLECYNGYLVVEIVGEVVLGISIGIVMDMMEKLVV